MEKGKKELGVRKAAREFDVPCSTLIRRVKSDKPSNSTALGPSVCSLTVFAFKLCKFRRNLEFLSNFSRSMNNVFPLFQGCFGKENERKLAVHLKKMSDAGQ